MDHKRANEEFLLGVEMIKIAKVHLLRTMRQIYRINILQANITSQLP